MLNKQSATCKLITEEILNLKKTYINTGST